MSYEERRKNNVISVIYENDLGDKDLYSFDPDREIYTYVKDFDKELNQMALKVERKDLPKMVRQTLDSEQLDIFEIL